MAYLTRSVLVSRLGQGRTLSRGFWLGFRFYGKIWCIARVAQWLEQRIHNAKIVGSNPTLGTGFFLLLYLSRMVGTERLFGRISRQRGLDSENRVRCALDLLSPFGLIDSFEENKALDQKGIDF